MRFERPFSQGSNSFNSNQIILEPIRNGVMPDLMVLCRGINTLFDKSTLWLRTKKTIIELNVVNEESNAFATYLAQHGVNKWDMMVEIEKSFGRIANYSSMTWGWVLLDLILIR